MQLNKDQVTALFRDRISTADSLASRLAKEYTAERSKRPAAHNHENEFPARPVLGFDLHQTMTSDFGFPLLQKPFPGLKAYLDQMVSRNCCIHIATASMDRDDDQVVSARKAMIQNWATSYGLPIGWIGPNVDANVRLDDRGVEVNPLETPTGPDYVRIQKEAEQRLAETWMIDPDLGWYVKRTDVVPVGDEVTRYPEITDTGPDAPRGWSTPQLDIDIHRTVNPGWGSTREDKPEKGAIQSIQSLYSEGWQIQFSCAGWMRSTHTQAQSEQRLAAFRIYFRKYGIPFDRIVTKDDVDLWHDDKVIRYTTWAKSLPIVRARLVATLAEHPAYSAGILAADS